VSAQLEWWNLIFTLPFLLAAAFYLLLATGTIAAEHQGDVDGNLEHADTPLLDALGFLGIGRTPLSIVLTTLWLTWGFVGYVSNVFLAELLPISAFVPLSMLAAGTASVLLTRSLSRAVARFVPRSESFGVTKKELEGRAGLVRFEISQTFGSAVVADQHDYQHEVDCRVRPGEDAIPVGATIVLSEYDEMQDFFYVLSEQKIDELIAAR
jgi:hypothetical protein